MATEIVIRNCTLETFKNTFKSKKEYMQFTEEMSLKERAISWKPTNALEANLLKYLEDPWITAPFKPKKMVNLLNRLPIKKLAKFGMKVTSYLVKEGDDFVLVYISYGGKRLCMVRELNLLPREGREDDFGGFFHTTQAGPDLKLKIKTRYEYYKKRYTLMAIIGFIFFVIPGLLLGISFLLHNWLGHDNIKRAIVPALVKTFESPENEKGLEGKQS